MHSSKVLKINKDKMHKLYASEIYLRPICMDDVNALYRKWLMDEEVVKFLEVRHSDRSIIALKKYIKQIIQDPDRYFFMICLNEDDMPIGTISLNVNKFQSTAIYGFLIGERKYWGKDYACQAQVVLFDFAYSVIGLRKIWAWVYLENNMSHFNLRRLGFNKEGIMKDQIRSGPKGESTSDVVQYGLLKKEWSQKSLKFNNMRFIENG